MIALALGLFLLAGQEEPPALAIGSEVTAEIRADDPEVTTRRLSVYAVPGFPARGRVFRLESSEPGPVVVEMRSWHCDPYLVLRDGRGEVLAEDDNGLFKRHARLAVELAADVPYRLEASALDGTEGLFTLRVRRGPLAPPTRDEALAEARAAEAEGREIGDELQVFWALTSRIHLALDVGDSRAAAPLIEQAVPLRERLYGRSHPIPLRRLADRAAVRVMSGRPDEARAVLEDQLARMREIAPPDHPIVVQPLHDLGQILARAEPAERARPLYERALEIARRTPDVESEILMYLLAGLADLEKDADRDDAARALLDEAQQVAEKHLAAENPFLGYVLNSRAKLARESAHYLDAERDFARAVAIFSAHLGPDHAYTATLRASHALVLQDLGRYREARAELEQALAIQEQELGADNIETTSTLENLARVEESLADLVSARRRLERVLEIRERVLGRDHPLCGVTRANLARMAHDRGETETGRAMLEEALGILQAAYGADNRFTLNKRGILAGWIAQAGELERALEMFNGIETTLTATRDASDPYLAEVRSGRARVLLRLGRVAEAADLLAQALGAWEAGSGAGHPLTSAAVDSLTQCLLDLGEKRDAWERLTREAEAGRTHLTRTLWALTEDQRFRFLAGKLTQLQLLVGLAAQLGRAEELQAYTYLLDWKGRISRDLLGQRELAPGEGADGTGATLEELRALQAHLSLALVGGDASSAPDASVDLAALESRRAALERELLERPGVQPLQGSTDPEKIARSLPAGTALVDFLVMPTWVASRDGGRWSPDHARAWILGPAEGTEPFRFVQLDLGPAAELEDAIHAHLAAMVGAAMLPARRGIAGASETAASSGERLRRILWTPLEPHLRGIQQVFLSPDGVLATLPFETLRAQDGSYLVERYSFVYVQDAPTLQRLLASSTTERRGDSLLAVGGVDFARRDGPSASPADESTSREWKLDDTRGRIEGRWAPLPGTVEEARAIVNLQADSCRLSGVAPRMLFLSGGAATEERLKSELPRHSVLHLATHGFFQPSGLVSLWDEARHEPGGDGASLGADERALLGSHPGLLSGLVCAGASDRPVGFDDGYLTAEEVSWLALSGADLVVLSACDTALGRARSGEGLLGLRRAFEMAGARTVLSSLWSVGDRDTSELMLLFYRQLWLEQQPAGAALRAAQLEMLARRRSAGTDGDPAAWGAFVLSGDWR